MGLWLRGYELQECGCKATYQVASVICGEDCMSKQRVFDARIFEGPGHENLMCF